LRGSSIANSLHNPAVSVVVAARNAASTIEPLLDSLATQTLSRDRFQVVVVDDDSTDETRMLIGRREWIDLIPIEMNAGAPVARNIGVGSARAPLIAFTDADCVAAPDWLERGLERFGNVPELDMLGGRVIVAVDDSSSVCALVDASRYLNQEGSVRSGQAVTANFWVRRDRFEAVGGFNERLAKLGYPDTELTAYLSATGARLDYGAQVAVHHPPRDSARSLARKAYRLGVGHAPFRHYGRAGYRYRRLPLFLRPRRMLPRGAMSGFRRLEQQGVAVGQGRRLAMIGAEVCFVSAPMFAGDVAGTVRSLKR
jgi:glycosyltransferase involved in cell wall biosynthesis